MSLVGAYSNYFSVESARVLFQVFNSVNIENSKHNAEMTEAVVKGNAGDSILVCFGHP